MPTIEKLAETFAKAANELMEATGTWSIMKINTPYIEMQSTEEQFNNIFGDDGIKLGRRDCLSYPVEKSIMVGGVKFYCLSNNIDLLAKLEGHNDFDTWAKLKGYVRKEAV